MAIELSDDQVKALQAILEAMTPGAICVLVGPAGSGKTTLMRFLINELTTQQPVVLGAPTGKAAARLRDITQRDAKTMHGLLYGRADIIEEREPLPDDFFDLPAAEQQRILDEIERKAKEKRELVFEDPHEPCSPGDAIIIDEGSMVGTKLFEEFHEWVPPSSPVLYVADREQLPPVKDGWGPDLEHPTAALTQVHRQALESPILAYATEVRCGNGDAWENNYANDDPRVQVYEGVQSAIDWLVFQREQKADATLVTYTHKTRKHVNSTVRSLLGLQGPIDVGDKLVVKSNNKATGLMNGDVVTVKSIDKSGAFSKRNIWTVRLEEYIGDVFINLDFIEGDGMDFYAWKKSQGDKLRAKSLHVHYGQCLTVHSSQGSQWDRVGFVRDQSFQWLRRKDGEEARRLLYTAITRAAEELALFV